MALSGHSPGWWSRAEVGPSSNRKSDPSWSGTGFRISGKGSMGMPLPLLSRTVKVTVGLSGGTIVTFWRTMLMPGICVDDRESRARLMWRHRIPVRPAGCGTWSNCGIVDLRQVHVVETGGRKLTSVWHPPQAARLGSGQPCVSGRSIPWDCGRSAAPHIGGIIPRPKSRSPSSGIR